MTTEPSAIDYVSPTLDPDGNVNQGKEQMVHLFL